MIYGTLVAYLIILLAIGAWSARRGVSTAEDYFLAGRGLGSLVLFMALFGTNVTAFAMMGLPGLAYHVGVGVFGFFGVTAAFFTPLCFILLGYPIWNLGRRHGYVTQGQMFADRWASPALGILTFLVLVHYTFPYLVVGLIGGGRALAELSRGEIPYWAGAALVAGVAVIYTSLGGMRATAWTNVFQSAVFLIFLVIACVLIGRALGGPVELHRRLVEEAPHLLGKGRGPLTPGMWATGFLVGPVSVIAFPHMFMRLLAARDIGGLRRSVHLYPWALVLLFIPVTLIGVWGALDVPGLVGKESDRILPLLVEKHLPPLLSALGLAAILAAVMSSLDGQLLTISTMSAIDLFRRQGQAQLRVGRLGVVVLAAAAYGVALWQPASIFRIAAYSFSGYTLLIPVMVAAFFWRRSTAAGVVAGSLAGHGFLAFCYVDLVVPGLNRKWLWFPVATCMIIEIAVMVWVSLATAPPPKEHVEKFRDPYGAAGDDR